MLAIIETNIVLLHLLRCHNALAKIFYARVASRCGRFQFDLGFSFCSVDIILANNALRAHHVSATHGGCRLYIFV